MYAYFDVYVKLKSGKGLLSLPMRFEAITLPVESLAWTVIVSPVSSSQGLFAKFTAKRAFSPSKKQPPHRAAWYCLRVDPPIRTSSWVMNCTRTGMLIGANRWLFSNSIISIEYAWAVTKTTPRDKGRTLINPSCCSSYAKLRCTIFFLIWWKHCLHFLTQKSKEEMRYKKQGRLIRLRGIETNYKMQS